MVRAHVIVTGFVQGVGFRHGAGRKAEALGLTGWVRNLPAGRHGTTGGKVEVVFEGEKGRIEEAVSWCREGPSLSEVKNVDVVWEKPTGEFEGFEIR